MSDRATEVDQHTDTMMSEHGTSISERLFEGGYAEGELEEALDQAGVIYDRLGWDHYDCSVEICGAPADYRLSVEAQRTIHLAGFSKAYVNHADKWETHYNFKPNEPFVESKGWRVSYPDKRGAGEEGIWVEEAVPSWPQSWFDTGYCQVKQSGDRTAVPHDLSLDPRRGEVAGGIGTWIVTIFVAAFTLWAMTVWLGWWLP